MWSSQNLSLQKSRVLIVKSQKHFGPFGQKVRPQNISIPIPIHKQPGCATNLDVLLLAILQYTAFYSAAIPSWAYHNTVVRTPALFARNPVWVFSENHKKKKLPQNQRSAGCVICFIQKWPSFDISHETQSYFGILNFKFQNWFHYWLGFVFWKCQHAHNYLVTYQ